MKTIDTLVNDIFDLFRNKSVDFDEQAITDFTSKLAGRIKTRLSEKRQGSHLRLSNLGQPDRKLWYSINQPEKAEPLPPEAEFKYLFGDILEELLLWLAKQAGHEVVGEQDELNLYGVKGHRDAVIDGVTVDAKSASSYSFDKFANHLTPDSDTFGYITQLSSYIEAASADELVADKTSGAFLVVDKQLGKITLDKHRKNDVDYNKEVEQKRAMLASKQIPPRCYAPEPDGKSGNMKLSVPCSYCEFRRHCWPGVRTFIYASGPRYLTRVERLPDVPEV